MQREHASGRRVVVISHDVAGKQMAGPGIRYSQLARLLASEFSVTLAVPKGSRPEMSAPYRVLDYGLIEDMALREAAGQAGVIIVPAIWLARLPYLAELDIPLVIDGYDPYLAETLAMGGRDLGELQDALALAYQAGDFFVCASERQRDWWLGLLEANGRINAQIYREDPSLRCLVDVVPFGLPASPPVHTRRVFKGIRPGIGEGDRIVLWGGGLWPWLDADSAIRAAVQVAEERQDLRLLFPGTRHPNPIMANLATISTAAEQTARELGALEKTVFFGDWVPYNDWPNVLLESDVALSLHRNTVETRLAFRSRVLDYIWAGLPIIATEGDATSEMVDQYGLGTVVRYGDVEGIAFAIVKMLEMPPGCWQDRFDTARQALTWERVAAPLIEFCRRPRRAPGGDERRRCEQERDYWRDLAVRYERGRFMRFMAWVHNAWQRSEKGKLKQ